MTRTPEAIAASLAHILTALASEDPLTRITLGAELNGALLGQQAAIAALRSQAVTELRSAGWTQREIGESVGVTAARVCQLESGMSGGAKRLRSRQLAPGAPRKPTRAPAVAVPGEGAWDLLDH